MKNANDLLIESNSLDIIRDCNMVENNSWVDEKVLDILEKIPQYNLEDWLSKLSSFIESRLWQASENTIIQIAWWSASWKTTAIANNLQKRFWKDLLILSMDDYYKWKWFMNSEKEKWNSISWDQPEALNIDLFKSHLKDLQKNQSIDKPNYCMKTSETISTEILNPKKVIIVEWLFTLNERFKDIWNLKVFINTDISTRIIRRMKRDVVRTGQTEFEILKYYLEEVEPMYNKHIEKTKWYSNMIINNNYTNKEA